MMPWLPSPAPSTLIPPNRDHDFFSYARAHPFEAAGAEFSSVNAAWLADLALLAYDDPPHVAAALEAVGLRLTGRQPVVATEAGSAQAYVAHDEQMVFVVFRGTEMPVRPSTRGFLKKSLDSLQDLLTNAQLGLVEIGAGRSVHGGFQAALDAVWQPLVDGWLAPLASGREVWFTGHSLGGAMATLAASRWPQPAGLMTFGAPRVGNQTFAADLDGVRAWRLMLGADLVTTVPPAMPDCRLEWLPAGYRHAGVGIHIGADGRFDANHGADCEPPSALVEIAAGLTDPRRLLAKGDQGSQVRRTLLAELLTGRKTLADALYDHAPLYYALATRRAAGLPDGQP